jgi:hypothetical protein
MSEALLKRRVPTFWNDLHATRQSHHRSSRARRKPGNVIVTVRRILKLPIVTRPRIWEVKVAPCERIILAERWPYSFGLPFCACWDC